MLERWRLFRLRSLLKRAVEQLGDEEVPAERDVLRSMMLCARALSLVNRLHGNEVHHALHKPLEELVYEWLRVTLELPQLTRSGDLIHEGELGYASVRHLPASADWRRAQTAKIRALAW